MLVIVASVLVALAADQWRQGRADRVLAAQALEGIRSEIARNLREVEQVLPYHDSLVVVLRSTPPPREGISLRPAFIRNNAWESAQAAGVPVHLDFRVLSAVSEISELQRAYQDIVRMATQILYAGNASPEKEHELAAIRASQAVLVSDLAALERRLQARYREALSLVARDAQVGNRPR